MKGSNTFVLNQATLNEAVEEYLRRRLSPSEASLIESVSVRAKNEASRWTYHADVEFGEPESEEPKP